MKQTTFKQARINSKNQSPHYFEGMIVDVVEIEESKKFAIIRVNSHSKEHSIQLDWLDL